MVFNLYEYFDKFRDFTSHSESAGNTINEVLIKAADFFISLLLFNGHLLNNKFVPLTMYVNKFNGVIVA